MTVWSIFVIVVHIPQFLCSLNIKFKKRDWLLSTKWILNAVVLSFLAAIKNILLGSEKNVKFCLCWWPDTSVPKACLSLSLSMMPPSLYLSSSGTQLALPDESQSHSAPSLTTLGQKPILVSHRSPTQMNQISVFQRRQEWIVSPVFSRKVTHSCVMISS